MGGRTTTKPGQDMGPTSLEKNNYLLEQQTRDQAESDEWKKERSKRRTASDM